MDILANIKYHLSAETLSINFWQDKIQRILASIFLKRKWVYVDANDAEFHKNDFVTVAGNKITLTVFSMPFTEHLAKMD
jgi:hypothetical protein